MASDIDQLCDDLLAERSDLDAILAEIGSESWGTATLAEGWSVLDQVTHLAWFDDAARRSIVEPDEFRAGLADVVGDVDAFVDEIVTTHRHLAGPDARQWLNEVGVALCDAARASTPGVRAPWYGPDMTVASTITARIMETWAHGQDIADAVGVQRTPSDRLRHIAFIGTRAFANSFRAHGLDVPVTSVRVDLDAPSGAVWSFGPDDATETVSGTALDFCLLVTQRCHRQDTTLVASGPVTDRWLDIAQAFAGPPGAGRAPRGHRMSEGAER